MVGLDNEVAFIMPVYNEQEIIEEEINNLLTFLSNQDFEHRVYVVENGSSDQTPDLLDALEAKNRRLNVMNYEQSNFGFAFKKGVKRTDHEYYVLVHADHWDRNFIRQAVSLLDQWSLIQASKNLENSVDKRPFLRKVLTRCYNSLLWFFLGFKGTDTTGLKAFRKSEIQPILDECTLEREMLETELVVRCEWKNVPVKEVPVTLEKKRPQRDPLFKKVWTNVIDLVRLIWTIDQKKEP